MIMRLGQGRVTPLLWVFELHRLLLWPVTGSHLTLSPRGDLLLDSQHQFGLSGQVLAAALLVLQRYGDATGQVVHAADDGRVSVGLRGAINEDTVKTWFETNENAADLLLLCFTIILLPYI